MRKGLLWLTVSEVSVRGCLALLLWACVAQHIMVDELLTSWQLEEKKGRG
jgi:hypothetical protein